jgi:hypothetical protein
METGAIVMLLIGAVGLWGTLAVAILNYVRRSAADSADTAGEGG